MGSRRSVGLRCLLACALGAAGLLAVSSPTGAQDEEHPTVVSQKAASGTAQLHANKAVRRPHVDALARIAGTIYIGGYFRRVADDDGRHRLPNVASLDESTGQVNTDFSVDLDGPVYALATYGNSVFIGGDFRTANGTRRTFLVKVNSTTGAVREGFDAGLRGRVNDLVVSDDRLFVAGSFRQRLVALDPGTGDDTGFFDLDIAGDIDGSRGSTSVYEIAINEAGTRLVGVGNFETVDGQARRRAFMAQLDDGSSTLDDWYYDSLAKHCNSKRAAKIAYLQGVDFAPDGTYFVLVSTGSYVRTPDHIGETVCDAAARFETADKDPERPSWINYSGGDSIWSVAVTGAAVYVQGHIRWLDNPNGRNGFGEGAKIRRGIGAIKPGQYTETGDEIKPGGHAMTWHPVKTAQVGGEAFLATPTGLWVGSDSAEFAGDPHRGVAYVPLPPSP